MNILEKILEEIKKLKCNQDSENQDYITGYMSALSTVEGIIAEENDGWIPVEERLPNKREFQEAHCRNNYAAEFLVTIEGATRPTTLYFKNNSWFDEERNYYKVIAWQPLPEAYHPKEIPAAEHIMSRFTRVE